MPEFRCNFHNRKYITFPTQNLCRLSGSKPAPLYIVVNIIQINIIQTNRFTIFVMHAMIEIDLNIMMCWLQYIQIIVDIPIDLYTYLWNMSFKSISQ